MQFLGDIMLKFILIITKNVLTIILKSISINFKCVSVSFSATYYTGKYWSLGHMKLRRLNNPAITLITIVAFMVCFGASLWFAHAYSYKNTYADQAPILRSAANVTASTANYRRNVESNSFQPTVTIAHYFVITANGDNTLFAYVTPNVAQSPWLICGKISIPTRADPNLLIA